jgi:hypothetical protein
MNVGKIINTNQGLNQAAFKLWVNCIQLVQPHLVRLQRLHLLPGVACTTQRSRYSALRKWDFFSLWGGESKKRLAVVFVLGHEVIASRGLSTTPHLALVVVRHHRLVFVGGDWRLPLRRPAALLLQLGHDLRLFVLPLAVAAQVDPFEKANFETRISHFRFKA